MTTSRTPAGRTRLLRGLRVGPDRIAGRVSGAATEVAILLDGAVQAIVPTTGMGFAWPLPPQLFGRLLDVVAVDTGASLLDRPFDFEACRCVLWGGWRFTDGIVAGHFTLTGAAARPGPALPVALISPDGAQHGHGYARWDAGRYAFTAAIDRLPAGPDGLALQPRVGGLLLPPALHIPATAFAFLGAVEPAEPWRVRGWVLEPARMETPVQIELRLDGVPVATASAARPRSDVAAAGWGTGRAGFDLPLPARLDRAVLVDVRIDGGPSLGGSPYLRPASPRFIGYLDGVDGFSAGGWAIDLAAPDGAVRVEALCAGVVIGSGMADLHRGDVAEAGLPTGRCGFQLTLAGPPSRWVGQEIAVRVAGTDQFLRGSPQRVSVNPNAAAFLTRRQPSPAALLRLRRRLSAQTRDVLVSLVMPVHETRADWLAEAIGSVTAQWSDNWELVCVDDGSRAPHVGAMLAAAAASDPRIRVLRTQATVGIAGAVNFGLRAARGDYVVFLDHDDALEPDAVFHLARAVRRTGADLLYSDEILTGPALDQVLALRARPAWSHDYYLSHPYFVHLVAVRATLARALAGYDERMTISADVDFVLRAIERTDAVAHIPRVLYRWRTHPGSAGHRRQDEVMAATSAALTRHLERLGRQATVRPGLGFNQFRIDWPDDGGEVLIVIPTKDRVDLLRRCIGSIERTEADARYRIVVVDHESSDPETLAFLRGLRPPHAVLPYRGPFNFARMNNQAVRRHGGAARYVLFLNNDVEAVAPGWLERLRSLAGRPEVGAVGPLLLYGNERVQHAGVIIGFGGTADHAMRFADAAAPDGSRNPGYNGSLTSVRDFSAVTAACMMLRREAFERADGFDESFAVGFNDTDLCLRLRARGLKVLYDGFTVLLHHESATRVADQALADPTADDARFRQRWAAYFDGADPFYSPLLSLTGADHRLREDDGWRGRLDARTAAPPD